MALNIIELYPHPDFVKGLGHIKLRNQLMKNTDKKLSKTKATQKAEALLDYAKE
ncbi:hypothetical protein ACNAN0_01975 [Agrilactobacillus fermenti]|uniref:hypothetical protein n=1 Tax=Agrilactobacillus fermenti TaxID=2586909 RepID=UPI003A5BCE2F